MAALVGVCMHAPICLKTLKGSGYVCRQSLLRAAILKKTAQTSAASQRFEKGVPPMRTIPKSNKYIKYKIIADHAGARQVRRDRLPPHTPGVCLHPARAGSLSLVVSLVTWVNPCHYRSTLSHLSMPRSTHTTDPRPPAPTSSPPFAPSWFVFCEL